MRSLIFKPVEQCRATTKHKKKHRKHSWTFSEIVVCKLLWKGAVQIHTDIFLGEKYTCYRYSKVVILTSRCPYNVKLHWATLPCLGRWVRYPRVPKSVTLFRLVFLQHQVCLCWDDLLSTTLSSLMCSSHVCHTRDGLQQWWDILVCLERALTWCDGLIPHTVPPGQSKTFWCAFLTSGTSMLWRKERIFFLRADHLTAWASLELKEYLFRVFWLEEEITVGNIAWH